MVDNFAKADPAVANAFFQQFYTALLQDLFFVLTDTDHKSGMPEHRHFITTKLTGCSCRVQNASTAFDATVPTRGILYSPGSDL